MGLSYIVFIILKYVLSRPTFLRVFYHKWMLNFVKSFSASIEMILLLFSCKIMSDSFVSPWASAHQAPLSMGFPRQEYWNGLLFPSPGDIPDPGTKAMSPILAGRLFTTELPGKPKSPGE